MAVGRTTGATAIVAVRALQIHIVGRAEVVDCICFALIHVSGVFCIEVELICARATIQIVCTRPTVDVVVSTPAVDVVVAITSPDVVAATLAEDIVVAIISVEEVLAFLSVDVVVATLPMVGIVAIGAMVDIFAIGAVHSSSLIAIEYNSKVAVSVRVAEWQAAISCYLTDQFWKIFPAKRLIERYINDQRSSVRRRTDR